MSISRLPRLYFNGHFSWNPSTNNNDDYSDPTQYSPPAIPFDPASAMPNWPWLREQSFEGEPVTAGNFRQWSWEEPFDLGKDKQGQDRRLPPSEWNFFGGMECGFVTDSFPVLEQPPNPDNPGTPVFSKPSGTRISSFIDLDGHLSTNGDPVGFELQFNVASPRGPFGASPKLIDINPQSPFTSQIFADDFRLGSGSDGFAAPLTQPMHSRWLYFNRNYNQDNGLMIAGVASTVFQTTMANQDIEWTDDASDPVSQLREAAQQGAGVMLRMVSYDTMYFNGEFFGPLGANQFPGMMKMRDLYVQYFNDLERYKAGLLPDPPPPPCNRAYSRSVGWLGGWDHDEYVTFPGGRLLTPYVVPYQPYQPTADNAPAPIRPEAPVEPVPFGPLTVERDSDFTRITVDLISTLPELTSAGDFAPFGAVELGISIDGTYNKLITLLEDPKAYTEHYAISGGLLDIPTDAFDDINGEPLTRDQFDANPLVLMAGSYVGTSTTATPTVALFEAALNAQTNTRGLYVDEPDPGVSGPTTTFVIEVKDRNAPPTSQIGLVVMQLDDNFELVTGDDRLLEISYQAPSGQWIDIESETLIDATSGAVTVGLRGRIGPGAVVTGALPTIAFFPVATQDLPAGLSPNTPVAGFASGLIPALNQQGGLGNPGLLMSIGYCAVRLWPYHSMQLAAFENYLATTPPVDEVNNWVFANVYETFHLMFPVMDFIGTPQRFQAWRGRILEVTKPENFSTSGYMPPTRTLSGAQRTILERYDEYLSNVNVIGGLRSTQPSAVLPTRG